MAPHGGTFVWLFLAACLALTLPPPACSQLAGPTFSPAGCLDPSDGTATFRPLVEELDTRKGPRHFAGLPRGVHERTYAGTDLWNARGMNLTHAVRAMLGDPFAYYESALFTVFKMALLNNTAVLPNLVYAWWGCRTPATIATRNATPETFACKCVWSLFQGFAYVRLHPHGALRLLSHRSDPPATVCACRDRGHWPTTEDGPWPQYKASPQVLSTAIILVC